MDESAVDRGATTTRKAKLLVVVSVVVVVAEARRWGLVRHSKLPRAYLWIVPRRAQRALDLFAVRAVKKRCSGAGALTAHSDATRRPGRASGRRRRRAYALDERGGHGALMVSFGHQTPKRSPEPTRRPAETAASTAPTPPRRGDGLGRRCRGPLWLVYFQKPAHRRRTPRGGHVRQSLGRLDGVAAEVRRVTPSRIRSEPVVGSGAFRRASRDGRRPGSWRPFILF